MRYPAPHTSVWLTSGGTWSLIALAICACSAAVGFLQRHSAEKETILARRRAKLGWRNPSMDEPLEITYRPGFTGFPMGPDRS